MGEQHKENQVNFRWPKLEDLQALNLTEPLVLAEIRVKGVVDYDLTAIQLVFQNGIESPLFDSNNANATELQTYKAPNNQVT